MRRASSGPDSGPESREETTHRQRPSAGTPEASSSLKGGLGGRTRRSTKSQTALSSSQRMGRARKKSVLRKPSPSSAERARAGSSWARARPRPERSGGESSSQTPPSPHSVSRRSAQAASPSPRLLARTRTRSRQAARLRSSICG